MEVVYKKVDDYVDSLAPQIQPRISAEIEVFQQKTIDSLESQVVDAFRSLFKKDESNAGNGSRDMNDAAPDAYGGQSLPFADEIAKLTRNFTQLSDEAGDDLREIFDLTEGRGGAGQTQSRGFQGEIRGDGGGARGFLTQALGAVQSHLDENRQGSGGGQNFQLDGLLGVISNTVKDASRNPEEKARMISPEIKEKVGAKLREQHSSIAEQFTRIALEHIKRWLRGNTSSRDLGDGAKAEVEEHVKDLVKGIGGLFGKKGHSNEESSRGISDRAGGDGGEGGGFSKVISDKLSTGLAKVHREVRIEFRKILGTIEKQLFELLPDQFQRPLEKILGGNPFDSQFDRDAGSEQDRGFGDDIKAKLVSKLRDLVRKVQETLRRSILGVVNGGHRKFERESWVFVQDIVEKKVQRYLPNVKISVPDDIGNEGVSVGAPTTDAQFGGAGNSIAPTTGGQGGYDRPASQSQYGNQHNPPQQGYNEPPQSQYQDHRPGQQQNQAYSNTPPQGHQSHGSQGYNNQQYSTPQQYGADQSYGNTQNQGSYQPNQSYSQNQGYPPNQSYQQGPPESYQQAHNNQQGHNYQSNPGYGQQQGYPQGQEYRPNDSYGQGSRY
ncbi:hypothetical protein DM02DRAFT_612517 [Periconia macrospinosa]|uniref:Uncharacterized protein n=1 Tax=Periconia macrospinosa TaxID=97972 RepID=A0A2V1DXW9_9PLEO|nr:hypothetical protein DM02DRAFT_612517 [Periconia macrospinosa]